MNIRCLSHKVVAAAIRRPSCRVALGLLGLGLSAFVWPHFPSIDSSIAFASMFSLGSATGGAWLGARIDEMTRKCRRAAVHEPEGLGTRARVE